MNTADLMHSGKFHGPESCRFQAAANFDGNSSRLVSTNLIHGPGVQPKQTQYSQQKQKSPEELRGVLQNEPALQPTVSNAEMRRQLVGRQLLLLYFYHSSKCSTPECECRNGAYAVKYKLWAHMTACHESQCNYPHCSASKTLIRHHKRCRDKCCLVCGPVRTKLSTNRYTQSSNLGATESITTVPVPLNINSSVRFNINSVENYRASVLDTTRDEQPPVKGMTEPASSNCSQQEVRRSQASAKSPCEMKWVTQTSSQSNEQESHMLNSDPSKSILATSACDRLHDIPNPTKRRKIGPTSSSFAEWEVDSRMMKFGGLKTSSVKPIPPMVEQPFRYNQSSNLGATEFIDSVPVSSNRNSSVGFNVNSVENYRATALDIAQDEQPAFRRMIEPYYSNFSQQEVKSSQASAKIPCEMQGFTQRKTQLSEQESHMLKSDQLKFIPTSSACDRTHDILTPTKQRKIGPTSSSCTQWEVDSMMMNFNILKSVKPIPLMVEQQLRYTQSSNLGAAEFKSSLPVSSNINSSVGPIINLGENYRATALDTTQDEQPLVERMIEPAFSNCSQQEVRSSQASAKIPCEMQGFTHTHTQPSEQESYMLQSDPLKSILPTSACDRTLDIQTPTKRRKIGPTSSGCTQWEVDSRMMKFNRLKSVKPIPPMVEQQLRYTQSSNLGATEFISSVPVSSNIKTSTGYNINLRENYRATVLDSTQDEQPSVKWMIDPAFLNCSQQEVRSSQASAKISCDMQGFTHTHTQPSEHESHMLQSDPLKSILTTSARDRTLDILTPTKQRKIGPNSSSCTQWEVDSRMMKFDRSKTISVKPIPSMVEQPLRSQKAHFQQNCEMNEFTFWIPQADNGQIQEKQKKMEIGIPSSANTLKQAVKEAMQFEQEARSTPRFVGISSQKKRLTQTDTQVSLPTGHNSDMMKTDLLTTIEVNHIGDNTEDLQSLSKQKYIEPALLTCSHKEVEAKSMSVSSESASEINKVSQMNTQKCQPERHNLNIKNSSSFESTKVEPALVYIKHTETSQQGPFQKNDEFNKDSLWNPHAEHGLMQEQLVKQVGKESMQDKRENTVNVFPFNRFTSGKLARAKKTKAQAASLIESFNCEQIRKHIKGLQEWGAKNKEQAENKNGEKICTLCNVGKLTFRLPPIYCSLCPSRIKPKASYHFVAAVDARHCICTVCYHKIQSDVVKIYGIAYAKSKLMKKKNEEVAKEEVWVQCNNCKEWQHSICALFIGKKIEEGIPEYTCPNCYIEQIEMGVWKPLPQNVILQAKDLPTTCLSDHIEQRLCGQLRREREERAKALGKSFEEVPGTDELAVRVVSSVDKVLEVKKQFSQFVQIKDFPSTFPYKSKVLLLFQKIEGVDICLFCMFVQEYGSECCHPNQRRIYLSYLDSVKYFRPDVKTVTGEALRTFVFHEILIAYLDYSKRRGFASCYIWSSPPSEGDDYILNCHPETQKTPQTAKLREWYLKMLHKARKEGIVVQVTNMHDHFFVSPGEQKAKVTAARLPYFDGDYFSDEAWNVITSKLEQEEEHRQKHQNINKSTTKRSSRAAAQAEYKNDTANDNFLMKKLGDSICQSKKKNFLMIHLQHACTHCCSFIVSGMRWVCKKCHNFQLCNKCYELEQKLDERNSHPKNRKEKHKLLPIEVTDVPADTKDKDGIMKCEFFDTRHAFLSLCRENHYQFDTLRRAKHSSMMVLYHLHNPRVPVYLRTCNVCLLDANKGQGLHPDIDLDSDLCNDCYHKDTSLKHFGRVTAHPSIDDLNTKGHKAHKNQVQEIQQISITHVFQCVSSRCVYQNCQTLKGIFRHGMKCKTGPAQGCTDCRKMWQVLQLHALACKESECIVPHCMDLKRQWRSRNQV